mmetsp:Transcript_32639/g.91393  ORF Transcript_32639/g.91393 Transcript_32639/m.91393 type:complete len:255 (+) Transcript_32639:552-1316(+)
MLPARGQGRQAAAAVHRPVGGAQRGVRRRPPAGPGGGRAHRPRGQGLPEAGPHLLPEQAAADAHRGGGGGYPRRAPARQGAGAGAGGAPAVQLPGGAGKRRAAPEPDAGAPGGARPPGDVQEHAAGPRAARRHLRRQRRGLRAADLGHGALVGLRGALRGPGIGRGQRQLTGLPMLLIRESALPSCAPQPPGGSARAAPGSTPGCAGPHLPLERRPSRAGGGLVAGGTRRGLPCPATCCVTWLYSGGHLMYAYT